MQPVHRSCVIEARPREFIRKIKTLDTGGGITATRGLKGMLKDEFPGRVNLYLSSLYMRESSV